MASVRNDVYSLGVKKPLYEETYNSFVEEVLKTEKLNVNAFVISTYEILNFMLYVTREIDCVKFDKVQLYIHKLDYYKGMFNDFTFDNTGDGGRGYSLLKVEGDKYIVDIVDLSY